MYNQENNTFFPQQITIFDDDKLNSVANPPNEWDIGATCRCDRCLLARTNLCTFAAPVPCNIQNVAENAPTPPIAPNVASFTSLAEALPKFYSRKNEAYGDSFTKSVQRYGPISALTRMSDKWNRLENLLLHHADENDESVVDTLLDLASYCIMTVGALHNHNVDNIVETLRGEEKP